MKIFLAFLQSETNHPIPAYGFWEHYIKNGIAEAGHQWMECKEVDWALGLVPKSTTEQAKWKEYTWSKTLTHLKKNPADLFLSYLYPDQIDISSIAEIKKMGIPCVNFFCDNVREFKKIPREFSVFDLNWIPEYKAIKNYKNAGYPHINLPMPMWIAPQLRIESTETNNEVTFIGSQDIQRQMLFEDLVAKYPQIPLTIYGNGWKDGDAGQIVSQPDYTFNKKLFYQYHFIKNNGIAPYLRKISRRSMSTDISSSLVSKLQGSIGFDTYNQLTSESMLTLGINRYPSYHYPIDKPNTYSRLRDIEAPMLGACYLTEWTEGLDELYDIEKEINVYRSTDELIERIAALQADPLRRKTLRVNGQNRALLDHSIPQSLKRIKAALSI